MTTLLRALRNKQRFEQTSHYLFTNSYPLPLTESSSKTPLLGPGFNYAMIL